MQLQWGCTSPQVRRSVQCVAEVPAVPLANVCCPVVQRLRSSTLVVVTGVVAGEVPASGLRSMETFLRSIAVPSLQLDEVCDRELVDGRVL